MSEAVALETRERHSESYDRTNLESSSMALFVIDSDLRVTDVNERASVLARRPRGEIVGFPLDEPFAVPPRSMAVARRTLETGESSRFELVLTPPSGQARSVSVSASRFIDPMGERRGVLLVETP